MGMQIGSNSGISFGNVSKFKSFSTHIGDKTEPFVQTFSDTTIKACNYF